MSNLTILVLLPLLVLSDGARTTLSENWFIVVLSDSCALVQAAQFESYLLASRLVRPHPITAIADEDVI